MKKLLIIGGYGNFGSHIAHKLAADAKISLIIAGRSLEKAAAFCRTLKAINPPQATQLDINSGFEQSLAALAPDIVIHTSGPFQAQDYTVAQACVAQGCHYIDLADGREFVANIDTLHEAALARNVAVISGASSVPCLSSAVIDHYRAQFREIETVDYGISTAQRTHQGLATTAAALSYAGQPLTTLRDLRMTTVYGWQDMRAHTYPELGQRWLCNCDIPDLDLKLFVTRYPEIDRFKFGAGTELPLLQLGLWSLSWLVRWGIIKSLAPYAAKLLNIAVKFDRFGTANSGFHMVLKGIDAQHQRMQRRFHLIARSGHGPLIPCMPAIILAQRLARHEAIAAGARPCMGLITLPDYLAALSDLDMTVYENNQPINWANLST